MTLLDGGSHHRRKNHSISWERRTEERLAIDKKGSIIFELFERSSNIILAKRTRVSFVDESDRIRRLRQDSLMRS